MRLERVALSDAWELGSPLTVAAAPVSPPPEALTVPAESLSETADSLRLGVLARNIAVTTGGLALGGLAVGNLVRGNAAYVVYLQAKEDENPEYQQRIWDEQLAPLLLPQPCPWLAGRVSSGPKRRCRSAYNDGLGVVRTPPRTFHQERLRGGARKLV